MQILKPPETYALRVVFIIAYPMLEKRKIGSGGHQYDLGVRKYGSVAVTSSLIATHRHC
ncbi:hypothetical protein [Sphingobacterium haloxyli]|uniref:hypothetical protein n=1 Tax=Sphingobacterium haloxyli TaxID=2100533 RepID=UPI0013FD2645|nr:hypothetical protein [Sphingobacterium haloxyli]